MPLMGLGLCMCNAEPSARVSWMCLIVVINKQCLRMAFNCIQVFGWISKAECATIISALQTLIRFKSLFIVAAWYDSVLPIYFRVALGGQLNSCLVTFEQPWRIRSRDAICSQSSGWLTKTCGNINGKLYQPWLTIHRAKINKTERNSQSDDGNRLARADKNINEYPIAFGPANRLCLFSHSLGYGAECIDIQSLCQHT